MRRSRRTPDAEGPERHRWSAGPLTLEGPPLFLSRLGLHLLVGGLPVLAISGDVLGWVTLHTVAVFVMLPLLAALVVVVTCSPRQSDHLVLRGFVWGIVACACYDAFRLPTIYDVHVWNDFFGAVGGWATGGPPNFAVGYLWRYVGDGGGIAVGFFAIAATIRAGASSRKSVVSLAVAYAVCPVWTGLVLTDLLAPRGRELFPVTATTLALSLGGHLIYGMVLGLGYWTSRGAEDSWPLRLSVDFPTRPDLPLRRVFRPDAAPLPSSAGLAQSAEIEA